MKVVRLAAGALGPVLLATFPLISLFAQNQSDIETSVLRWPLLFCLGGALAVYMLMLALTKRTGHAAALSSLVLFGFFYIGVFWPDAPSWLAVLWTVACAASFVALLRVRVDLRKAAVVLAVAGAVMTLPQIVAVVRYQMDHPSVSPKDPRLWPTALPAPERGSTALPDIYVIIPDDYARDDVLLKYFNYDDGPFLAELEQRGFRISEQSRSPYSDSESNIAATLNMDYLSRFPKLLGEDSEDVRPVKRVIADSRAARLATQAGYRYFHLDTDEVTFARGNPDISSLAPPDSFANLWLRKSLLRSIGGPLGFSTSATNARYRESIRHVFAQLRSLPTAGGPKFVVFHTLLPHDPYVYRSNGETELFEGDTDASLSSSSGRKAYLEQLEYLNSQLLQTIDAIQARASRPTAIVIQADEGFQAEPDVFGEAVMKDIRVKGMLAMLMPGIPAASGLPDPPNTVNSLRFVFNNYLGTNYPMLPSLSYPEGDLPYQFEPMSVR